MSEVSMYTDGSKSGGILCPLDIHQEEEHLDEEEKL